MAEVHVIGAGLIGLSSAHYLQQAGHAVCVVDAQASVAQGASFANGGLLTPSMSEPWNAPGVQWNLLRWLGRKDAPMLLRPRAMWHYLSWGLRFLRHANQRDYAEAIAANFALSQFSLERLERLQVELALDFDASCSGALKIWRDPAGFAAGVRAAQALGDAGLECRVLGVAELLALEPLLAPVAARLAGGIHYTGDRSGNALKFCQALEASLRQRGVRFELGRRVDALLLGRGRLRALRVGDESWPTAAVVVAGGADSGGLLHRIGVRCPVRPVKGYSLSVSLGDPQLMPRLPIIDDALHAAITPLGDQLRVAGTAEFSGWDTHLDPARVANLWELMQAVNPQMAASAQRDRASAWCGLRPMSADGKPLIGATAVPGVYLNTGHGHLGWTQAAGSACLLAAQISGHAMELNAAPYRPDRRI